MVDSPFLTPEGNGNRTLELEHNPTVLVVWAANRFNRLASRYYQTHFGISAMDWRMLVMLCKEPDIAVSEASALIGYDKGAVSRSLQALEEMKLVKSQVVGSNARNKRWRLTPKGQRMHDKILVAALERQNQLLEGFGPDEVQSFNRMLHRFLGNLDALEE
jgi:DNA-binding MarR family transcriptional regulator